MRTLIPIMLILVFAAHSAWADPNDLEGGVFIAHHAPTAVYTEGMDWCQSYYDLGYGIGSAEDQINRMDADQGLFYVIAAWTEEKTWCGTEFGFGDFDPNAVYFSEWNFCLEEGLEIPYAYWPGPNSGTAVVATIEQWEGNFVPIYYFVTYNYYQAVLPLDVDPAGSFGGFGNCAIPAVTWEAACFGAMGVFADGLPCYPIPPEQWACCDPDEVCHMMTEFECLQNGWDFFPGEDCDTFTCPHLAQPGACCIEYTGECFYIFMVDCVAIGGLFMGELIPCEPNPCEPPPTASCCVNTYECVVLSEYECELANGDWFPDVPDCDPNPCPSGADNVSWGSIKSLFR
jgi:hypothetical protein